MHFSFCTRVSHRLLIETSNREISWWKQMGNAVSATWVLLLGMIVKQVESTSVITRNAWAPSAIWHLRFLTTRCAPIPSMPTCKPTSTHWVWSSGRWLDEFMHQISMDLKNTNFPIRYVIFFLLSFLILKSNLAPSYWFVLWPQFLVCI